MPVRIGYLLPTREQVMQGRPEAAPLLALAERAEDLGYDSIWVGDSILARPRHEPLTLLSAVAARTRRTGRPHWLAGEGRASPERVGRLYDGCGPNSPDPEKWRAQWSEIQAIASAAGRDPARLTGAVYLTLTIDDNAARAEARMNQFMEG